jgi:hypothetical protein
LRPVRTGLVRRPGRLAVLAGTFVIGAAMVLEMINSVMLITDSSAGDI